jgi:hypothetical protein
MGAKIMRYWPISTIRNWSYLAPEVGRGLDAAIETRKLTQECYTACVLACDFVPAAPVHGLVLIKDEDSLPKHAYLNKPPIEELRHLERFCMYENFDGEMFLMIHSLH